MFHVFALHADWEKAAVRWQRGWAEITAKWS